jgi:hypothetical protein
LPLLLDLKQIEFLGESLHQSASKILFYRKINREVI